MVRMGEKEADEREREESMSTEIKEESLVEESLVEDIEEKKQDVEKKPRVTVENENTFDKFWILWKYFKICCVNFININQ